MLFLAFLAGLTVCYLTRGPQVVLPDLRESIVAVLKDHAGYSTSRVGVSDYAAWTVRFDKNVDVHDAVKRVCEEYRGAIRSSGAYIDEEVKLDTLDFSKGCEYHCVFGGWSKSSVSVFYVPAGLSAVGGGYVAVIATGRVYMPISPSLLGR
jgi:hypothetical protein